ncbi:gliding motility-associated C-terminal domain-containing protein [Geojedonia litorea]|uniref:Gliding motility-associated C-terminal domain-containing protein n=1 Tax=Geojedonia litorea TaxID=1268269 RepID=A0ABV9N0S5_9FLAO
MTDENDNCSTGIQATYQDEVTPGACEGSFVITRTWSLVDNCNNAAEDQVQIITVSDNTAPTFTAPASIEIFTDADCNYDASIAITGDVTDENDNCSTGIQATYQDEVTPGACEGSFVITRTWSLVDNCNNAAADQVQTITVTDNTAPTFTAPASIEIFTDADCNYDASIAITGDVTDENDNCSTGIQATYQDEVTPGACEGSFVITRTWSLVDNCNNAAQDQVQTITVTDNTAPTFTAPASIEIFTDADCNYDASIAMTGDVTDENDNCSTGIQATYQDEVTPGACEGSFVITRTWSLVDNCNNAAQDQVQTITVTDNTAPTFTAPASIEIFTAADCGYDISVGSTGDVTDENDNCSTGIQATYQDEVTPGACEGSFVITRTWSLVDNCNNTAADQVQIITVSDNTAPTFTAPVSIEIFTDADCNYDISVGSTGDVTDENDNCSTGIQATYVDSEPTPGTCEGSFVITRTWSLVDNCNNAAEDQVQTITITDNTAPELVTELNRNISVTCDNIPEVPQLNFQDNCSAEVTVAFNESSTNSGNASNYVITRNWTVTDGCNNEATITQSINVTVSDVTANDAALCITEDFDLDLFTLLNGVNDTSGTWTVVEGNATINGSLFNPTTLLDGNGSYTDSQLGVYTFRYESSQNSTCPTEVEVSITINDECVVLPCGAEDVIISKAVTPNGDNINDFFGVTGVESCGFVIELQIFNRWGAKIYENFNYQNDWYGTSSKSSFGNSNTVPTGTYYYIINLKNSGLKPFAGPIYVGTK